jgi:NAD(P)H-flavin reductase/hemoglobin-like flavoprotein
VADLDTAALKENFAAVANHGGDEVALYFYSCLFYRHPETRQMFPPRMTRQRDRLVSALGHIVSNVDDARDLVPFLTDLGRDHRKFGALAAHYPAVGEALVDTLRYFSGANWSDELQEEWMAAYGLVAETMLVAAKEAAESQPAFWSGEVVAVEHRTIDIAVVRIRSDDPPPYRAGQSLSVELMDLRPREWRSYTPASKPGGEDFEIHTRLIAGGPVSTTLVTRAAVGTRVRLGAPVGRMVLDDESERPVLMIAGSTGLAPMKAMIEQLAEDGGRPTHLFFGARTPREIYDGPAIDELDRANEWLSVVTAISNDKLWKGERGLIGEVALAHGEWTGHDTYVCGSPAMVENTVKLLVADGVPENQIYFDEFGES